MFTKMARRRQRLFSAAYGEEHLAERLNADGRMGEIHEERREFFAVSFLIEMWGRMAHHYNSCVVGGFRYILGKYDEGVTFGNIKRYALPPGGQQGNAWGFTPIFDFGDDGGFWRGVILPEIRQERQRNDILNLAASRVKPSNDRNRKTGGRVGGMEEKPKSTYPTGPNLTELGGGMGLSNRPIDKQGGYSAETSVRIRGASKENSVRFIARRGLGRMVCIGQYSSIFLAEEGLWVINASIRIWWRDTYKHYVGKMLPTGRNQWMKVRDP